MAGEIQENQIIVTTIIERLQDADEDVRAVSVQALVEMAKDGKSVCLPMRCMQQKLMEHSKVFGRAKRSPMRSSKSSKIQMRMCELPLCGPWSNCRMMVRVHIH